MKNSIINDRQQSGFSTKKKNPSLANFFRANLISMNFKSQIDDHQIRFSAKIGEQVKNEGEMIDYFQRANLLQKIYPQTSKKEFQALREYRDGELPDIQIAYQDILNPLISLATFDKTIAQEILVSIFVEIYKECKSSDTKDALLEDLLEILSQSKCNFSVINTLQTILYHLSLKEQN